MRDSRIGTYGTIVVILSLLVRVTALAGFTSITAAAAALVTLNCLSRGAIVVLLATLEPARPEGMGAAVGHPGPQAVLAGILLAVAPIVFWPPLVSAAVFGAAAIATFTMWGLGRRRIRGYTGDLLGAGQQVCECAGWIVLAAMIS
jgi:adenosylcobinamide-GDP ribazoletransferase